MSEDAHPQADQLDQLTTRELLEVMQGEDALAVEATRPALADLARAIDAIAGRLRSGGRLHYFGAGTSGRIAALDALELSATFGIEAGLVQAHEGGDDEQEDDEHRGRDQALRSGVGAGDVALGIR